MCSCDQNGIFNCCERTRYHCRERTAVYCLCNKREERLQRQYRYEHRPMFVFCTNGRIVGYYSLLQENEACELNNLCVLPEYRHQGIGAEMLKHAFQQAVSMGCTVMNIGIVEENQKLRLWYESFDFVHQRTQKFDFFPFTCGYMRKSLK